MNEREGKLNYGVKVSDYWSEEESEGDLEKGKNGKEKDMQDKGGEHGGKKKRSGEILTGEEEEEEGRRNGGEGR